MRGAARTSEPRNTRATRLKPRHEVWVPGEAEQHEPRVAPPQERCIFPVLFHRAHIENDTPVGRPPADWVEFRRRRSQVSESNCSGQPKAGEIFRYAKFCAPTLGSPLQGTIAVHPAAAGLRGHYVGAPSGRACVSSPHDQASTALIHLKSRVRLDRTYRRCHVHRKFAGRVSMAAGGNAATARFSFLLGLPASRSPAARNFGNSTRSILMPMAGPCSRSVLPRGRSRLFLRSGGCFASWSSSRPGRSSFIVA